MAGRDVYLLSALVGAALLVTGLPACDDDSGRGYDPDRFDRFRDAFARAALGPDVPSSEALGPDAPSSGALRPASPDRRVMTPVAGRPGEPVDCQRICKELLPVLLDGFIRDANELDCEHQRWKLATTCDDCLNLFKREGIEFEGTCADLGAPYRW